MKERIKELEDWNADASSHLTSEKSEDYLTLQTNFELLTNRNRQLELDYQRLQTQQRNNQLALERLDEYEETIAQLQEELERYRSNGKKSTSNETMSNLLEMKEKQLKEVIKRSQQRLNETNSDRKSL